MWLIIGYIWHIGSNRSEEIDEIRHPALVSKSQRRTRERGRQVYLSRFAFRLPTRPPYVSLDRPAPRRMSLHAPLPASPHRVGGKGVLLDLPSEDRRRKAEGPLVRGGQGEGGGCIGGAAVEAENGVDGSSGDGDSTGAVGGRGADVELPTCPFVREEAGVRLEKPV